MEQIQELTEKLSSMTALDAQRLTRIDDLAKKLSARIALDVQRVATIQELTEKIATMAALDTRRVARIEELSAKVSSVAALDAQRVRDNNDLAEKLKNMSALDAQRVKKIEDLAANAVTMNALNTQRLNENNDLSEKIKEQSVLDAQRVAKIQELSEKIETMAAQYAQRVKDQSVLDSQRVRKIEDLSEQIEVMTQLNIQRVTKIEAIDKKANAMATQDLLRLQKIKELEQQVERHNAMTQTMDGISTASRNLNVLSEARFLAAWEKAKSANTEGWPGGVPDVRWRAHVVLWAAQHGLGLQGDFVECGVHTGLYALTLLNMLDLEATSKKFYLFDTFDGIPLQRLNGEELERSRVANTQFYKNVWDVAQRNFAPFKSARLIRGELPQSIEQCDIEQIAFLSIDLNNAISEKETIDRLWDRIVPGAVIVLDDFAWIGHENQNLMWQAYAKSKGLSILTLPTGQGVMIKP